MNTNRIITLILLLCTMLPSVQARKNTATWQEVDTLIAQGHYTSAYEKGEQLFKDARCKGDGHGMLRAAYLLHKAGLHYQEDVTGRALARYKEILPKLDGADRAVGNMFVANIYKGYYEGNRYRRYPRRIGGGDVSASVGADYTQWERQTFIDTIAHYYALALQERDMLLQYSVEKYDMLSTGDEEGCKLRPTLYDVIVQSIIATPESVEADEESVTVLANDTLYGDGKLFVQMHLPQSEQPYIRQLCLLQSLTKAHLEDDAPLRASLDLLRFEYVKQAMQLYNPDLYISGLESLIEEYRKSPAWCAEFLYRLAAYYVPNVWNEQSSEDKAKAVAYCQEAMRIAPESNGGKQCRGLYEDIVRPNIGLAVNEIVLPNESGVVKISYKNIPDLYFRIVHGNIDESRYGVKLDELTSRKVVRKWSVKVDCPNAYTQHEVLADLPVLNPGTYWLLASNDASFSDEGCISYVRFDCTGLMLHMARDISRREVSGVVVNAKSGAPVLDCEIVLMKRTRDTYTLIEHFRSDDKGGFVIPVAEHSGNLMVKVTDGVSTTYREWSANPYERDTDDTELRCEMHTDRYTYRPGDTIQWNILACKVGYYEQKVLPNQEVTVVLKDKDYKTVSTVKGSTDEYGCLSGWFALPTNVIPGRFRFEIALGEKNAKFFHHQVNVEAFKAPTFNITLHTPKEILHLGDSVVLQGEVTTYTGLPVNGANIRYKVARTQQGRYASTQGVVDIGHITADEKGGFSIPFVAQYFGNTDKQTVCYYTITIDVTDESGETHSKTTTVRVGVRTATLSTDVPYIMQPGDKLTYALRNLNGQNVAAEVRLRIAKLNVPQTSRINSNLISRYPEARPLARDEEFLNAHLAIGLNDMFDKSTWHEEKVCSETILMTSEQGESAFIPELTEDGIYKAEFIYHDGDSEAKETAYFTRLHKGSSRIPGLELLIPYAPERIITAGGSAPLYIGTHYENVHVYYIVQQGYRIIGRGELTLSNQLTPITIHAPEGNNDQIAVYAVTIKEGVVDMFVNTFNVVPQSDKLDIAVSTFRNYLEPGETEQCALTIRDHAGNAVQAAATVGVVDAALDVYGMSDWSIPTRGTRYMWQYLSEFFNHTTSQTRVPYKERYTLTTPQYYQLPYLAMPSYRMKTRNSIMAVEEEAEFAMASGEHMKLGSSALSEGSVMLQSSALELDYSTDGASSKSTQDSQEASAPYLRKELRHTALFHPNLQTDEQGRVVFAVTAPDLLTKWHVKGIVHTKDLKHGRVNFDFITRKTLMVQPNVPRFLYEGDRCDFTAKVSNSGDEPTEAVVRLTIDDEEYSKTVSVGANSSTAVSFPIVAPAKKDYLTYRITVESQRYSDGEQATIPILPRRTLVTETMALYINGTEKREFVFDALKEKHSETLEHKSLTLDIVSNPIWYAIEALPSLSKEENPSNERLFHRYYAATMGSYLIDNYPEIEGHNDFYRRDSLTTLQHELLSRLADSQGNDGGWAWMNGFDSDRYTTLLIIKGLGELEAMHCLSTAQDDTLYAMVKRGIGYLDATYHGSYVSMEKKPKALDSYALYYLYVRSMFPEISFGTTPPTAYNYYKKLLLDDKATRGTLMQKALKMLALLRLTERSKAERIAEVVRQSALSNDEMGIYWRDNISGWGWDSNPIATQAMLIEAFSQLEQPADFIARMQQWLLKQKQTTQWSSSIATAQAVHALASPPALPQREGVSALTESIEVKVGGSVLRVSPDTAINYKKLGLIKQTWKSEEIAPAMAKVTLDKRTTGISWGSMTWQYYEDVDKVKASGTGLTLRCTYYKVVSTDCGEKLVQIDGHSPLEKGDRVRVRLHFTTDRAMDYVELHLKRPAALEPVSTRSGYAYSNGLGYYRSIENAQTVLYFYRLNKGKYFIDCDLWVGQSGDYSCGVSTIRCMYAPEFMATAKGNRLSVTE